MEWKHIQEDGKENYRAYSATGIALDIVRWSETASSIFAHDCGCYELAVENAIEREWAIVGVFDTLEEAKAKAEKLNNATAEEIYAHYDSFGALDGDNAGDMDRLRNLDEKRKIEVYTRGDKAKQEKIEKALAAAREKRSDVLAWVLGVS